MASGASSSAGNAACRQLMDEVAAKQGVKEPKDWRKVPVKAVEGEKGGKELLRTHGSSLLSLLAAAYPETNYEELTYVLERRPASYWDCQSHRQHFLATASRLCGCDVLRLTQAQIRQAGGSTLLARYQGSVQRMLEETLPERKEEIRRARRRADWSTAEARRAFVLQMAEELGIDAMDPAAWKAVRSRHVTAMGGAGLLRMYGNSVFRLLRSCLPDLDLREEDCRKSMPRNYWADRRQRRAFFDRVAASRNFEPTDADAWAELPASVVAEAGGAAILTRFSGSLHLALADAYPDVTFAASAFLHKSRSPPSPWRQLEARKAFLDDVAERLGVSEPRDWRRVTTKQVVEMGGASLLAQYGNSLTAALTDTYDHLRQLSVLEFRAQVPRGYWDVAANRQAFLASLAADLDVREAADWRRVTNTDVLEKGGAGLLHRHGGSLLSVLRAAGEDGGLGLAGVDAVACRPAVPATYWQVEENVRKFVRQLKEMYGVREKEDWYRISQSQVAAANGAGLLQAMDLADALWITYPNETWDSARCCSSAKKSTQRHLYTLAAAIFPATLAPRVTSGEA